MNTPMHDDHIAVTMKTLPEPAAPPSLRATVMARIAREADRPQTVPVVRERRHWLLVAAGLGVVIGATAYEWFASGVAPDFTSPRIGSALAVMPANGPIALAIGIGLLIYVAGLMGPLRSDERSEP